MSKTLIIAEKPSVARDIAKALGGFRKEGEVLESSCAIVSSGIGHLIEIHVPAADTTGKTLATLPVIPQSFSLRPIPRTKAQFDLLARLMARKDVDTIVNACDAGREGELIFRLIYEHAACKKPVKRMWLQSMTTDAIVEAYRTMKDGSHYDNLSDAAKCRSEADWLIGINGSRGISRLHESLNRRYEMMTAGRVQTPTLAILVHRENEINNFVPDDYWEVHAQFEAKAGTYIGKWFDPAVRPAKSQDGGEDGFAAGFRISSKTVAEQILAKVKGVAPTSVRDTQKLSQTPPPKLFDLTTLQREANKVFKFSAQKTLDLAQALYEKHKCISYPRTDAQALPEDYLAKSTEIMGRLGATGEHSTHAQRVLDQGWIKLDKRIFDNGKISDHFAIIPTGAVSSTMTAEEAKLFKMIAQRFIAAFYPAAEYSSTTRITLVAGESFKSTGRVLLKQGWMQVYERAATDSKEPSLCLVDPAEPVRTRKVEIKTLATKPPKRYTEATLLSAMEGAGKLVEDEDLREIMKGRGLGTPATRAATIEGLLSEKNARGQPKEPYVRREGKEQHLVPTPKGMNLVGFLQGNGIDQLTSPLMTGQWESKLACMERGEYRRSDFMAEIASTTSQILDVIRSRAGADACIPVPAIQVDHACPHCAGALRASEDGVDCVKRCGFRLWRKVAGKFLETEHINALLHTGECGRVSGFISKAGNPFSAALKMDSRGKVTFVF